MRVCVCVSKTIDLFAIGRFTFDVSVKVVREASERNAEFSFLGGCEEERGKKKTGKTTDTRTNDGRNRRRNIEK